MNYLNIVLHDGTLFDHKNSVTCIKKVHILLKIIKRAPHPALLQS